MKSTVEVTREMKATAEVEHPDGWTADEVKRAASIRSADIVDGCWDWESRRTTITGATLGAEMPVDESEDESMAVPHREPVELTAEDLA